jgi:hypothetical protein
MPSDDCDPDLEHVAAFFMGDFIQFLEGNILPRRIVFPRYFPLVVLLEKARVVMPILAKRRFPPFANVLKDEQTCRKVVRLVVDEILPHMYDLFLMCDVPGRTMAWKNEFEKALVCELQRIAYGKMVEPAPEAEPMVPRGHPDTAKQRLFDAFGDLGVDVSSLKRFIGHDSQILGPKDLQMLHELYLEIREGSTTIHTTSIRSVESDPVISEPRDCPPEQSSSPEVSHLETTRDATHESPADRSPREHHPKRIDWRIEKGKEVYRLYEELKHIRNLAKGGASEQTLRQYHEDEFEIWKKMDKTTTLARGIRQAFFYRLHEADSKDLYEFIGRLFGTGAVNAKLWRVLYRRSLKRSRRRRSFKKTKIDGRAA